jgi:hypothetical protein
MKSETMDKLEDQLRRSIEEHRDFLFSVIEDEQYSRQRFVSQLLERVAECDSLSHYTGVRKPFVKCLSLICAPARQFEPRFVLWHGV